MTSVFFFCESMDFSTFPKPWWMRAHKSLSHMRHEKYERLKLSALAIACVCVENLREVTHLAKPSIISLKRGDSWAIGAQTCKCATCKHLLFASHLAEYLMVQHIIFPAIFLWLPSAVKSTLCHLVVPLNSDSVVLFLHNTCERVWKSKEHRNCWVKVKHIFSSMILTDNWWEQTKYFFLPSQIRLFIVEAVEISLIF